jgi:MerR family transcriptional regulator, redox-sensitive transcriptional activator SoxR
MSDPLTIGELAARSGLPTSTLRYYDRIGLVPATGRSGGQRRYDPKVLQRLRSVTLCQRAGFSLEEIGRLLDGGRPWQALAGRKVEELQVGSPSWSRRRRCCARHWSAAVGAWKPAVGPPTWRPWRTRLSPRFGRRPEPRPPTLGTSLIDRSLDLKPTSSASVAETR